MTCELHDLLAQVKAAEEVSRGGFVRIYVLVGPRVSLIEVHDKE